MQPIIRGGTDETTSLCNSAGGSVLTVFHVYVPFLFSGFLIILLTVLLVQCLCHVHWTAEVAVGALRLHRDLGDHCVWLSASIRWAESPRFPHFE